MDSTKSVQRHPSPQHRQPVPGALVSPAGALPYISRHFSSSDQLRHVIEATVGLVFAIDPDDIRRSSRGEASVAFARQVAMYLAHVACCLPLSEVGRLFRRDRTTVRHACAVVEDRRDDPRFDLTIGLLERVVTRVADTTGLRQASMETC